MIRLCHAFDKCEKSHCRKDVASVSNEQLCEPAFDDNPVVVE